MSLQRTLLPALRQALMGRFRPHQAFLVSQLLAHLDHVDETVATLSKHIEEVITRFADELARLDTIHGVGRRTAEVLIAELGVDMTQFPSEPTPGELRHMGEQRVVASVLTMMWIEAAEGPADGGRVVEVPRVGGLHHEYLRRAA